jgi:hypothetical protein
MLVHHLFFSKVSVTWVLVYLLLTCSLPFLLCLYSNKVVIASHLGRDSYHTITRALQQAECHFTVLHQAECHLRHHNYTSSVTVTIVTAYTLKPHTSELPVRRTPPESEHFCSVPNVLLYIMYNAIRRIWHH